MKKNYDYTSTSRTKRRIDRIRACGLTFPKIIAHKDDIPKIREYAKRLYQKRGLKYTPSGEIT